MEIIEAEELLNGTQYQAFIGSLQKITLKDHVYDKLFKMGDNHLGYFVLKIRNHDEQNIIDSINNLKIIKDTEGLINKNIEVFEKQNYILAISKWLNGKQPINNSRDELPMFFSKLAVLNKNNIIGGPYTSMYLDWNYFSSTDELIDWEINYHRNYFSEKMDSKAIMEVMANLKHGMPCIINEDMNCGNLLVTDDGKYKIIDSEWIVKGINLYQFQHIDYFKFNERNWYTITDEAKECYEAYFGTLGVNNDEANEQIRAIELLNILRENTFWNHSGKENDAEIERRIRVVLGKDRFV